MRQRALHTAIIMDGNGRWARARGLPRTAGHRAGAGAVRRTVEAAPRFGIGMLTLYAFSSDNWRRPTGEVRALMRLLESFLRSETARCVEEGVQVRVIGRRDRLATPVLRGIEAAERATAHGTVLRLNIAVDYSSRHAIETGDLLPDVDLLIRTGGEQRLSDFLLWESAYAELHFTPVLWPDFTANHLEDAVADFDRRERRFGGLGPRPAASRVARSGGRTSPATLKLIP